MILIIFIILLIILILFYVNIRNQFIESFTKDKYIESFTKDICNESFTKDKYIESFTKDKYIESFTKDICNESFTKDICNESFTKDICNESFTKDKYIESFTDDKCNDFFDKNSFCQLDIDSNKCVCKFQKDSIKNNFYSIGTCCDRNCMKLSPDECVSRNSFTKIPYYCNIGGKCTEYTGNILNSHISANNCGNDPLNNQLLLPYATIEECQKSLDPCDKYNIPRQSIHINKANCLKDVNCGFCSNETGEGKCISGNASGASDMQKYYYCTPYQTDGKNNYEYGNHVAYLLQSSDQSSFNNIKNLDGVQ